MVAWILFVNYGYLHGVYSTRELALRAAQSYLNATTEDVYELELYLTRLKESFDKGLEYFNLENYITAEAMIVDEEFLDEDS